MIRTLLDDLDRGWAIARRVGWGRLLGGQAAAWLPGSVVLLAALIVPPTVALGAGLAMVALDVLAQGAFGSAVGQRLGLTDRGRAGSAVRFLLAVLVASLAVVALGVAIGAGVVYGAPAYVVGFAGLLLFVAAGRAGVSLGDAALAAVADPAPRVRAARRLALVAAQVAFGLTAFALVGRDFGLPGPEAGLEPKQVWALIAAQVVQLWLGRALAAPLWAWAWCTWAGVARGDREATEAPG